MSIASFRDKGSGLRELRHSGNTWLPCLVLPSSSPSRSSSSHHLVDSRTICVRWFQMLSQSKIAGYSWSQLSSGNWKTVTSWLEGKKLPKKLNEKGLTVSVPLSPSLTLPFVLPRGLWTGCFPVQVKTSLLQVSSDLLQIVWECSGSSFVINIYLVYVFEDMASLCTR